LEAALKRLFSRVLPLLVAVLLLAGCSPALPDDSPDESGRLRVVATTTLVGDTVSRVAGDRVELVTLVPAGTDPHSFQPTPRDVTHLADADLVFANGLGLEEFLDGMLDSANTQDEVIFVSDGIQALERAGGHEDEPAENHEGEPHNLDPHVWMDPNNVLVWVDQIESALAAADPQNAADYAENAEAYRQELRALDEWVRQQVSQVPAERRQLVTDHAVFGYFAERYGFEQVGAVIPGFSTLSEPSAQELAALQNAIATLGVPAILVGYTVNPNLAERVATDTGVQLVSVHTGSLTGPEGTAPTYLDFIRYNVEAIVSALQ
jgi:ABC-type Zn uptake system ZnuABC Zn-binding protein ZnuA